MVELWMEALWGWGTVSVWTTECQAAALQDPGRKQGPPRARREAAGCAAPAAQAALGPRHPSLHMDSEPQLCAQWGCRGHLAKVTLSDESKALRKNLSVSKV